MAFDKYLQDSRSMTLDSSSWSEQQTRCRDGDEKRSKESKSWLLCNEVSIYMRWFVEPLLPDSWLSYVFSKDSENSSVSESLNCMETLNSRAFRVHRSSWFSTARILSWLNDTATDLFSGFWKTNSCIVGCGSNKVFDKSESKKCGLLFWSG